MALPNAEEIKVLIEFRNRVNDVLKKEDQRHDAFLLRWLRARDLNQDKAEKMLRASLKWREENNVDGMHKTPVDTFFAREFPYKIFGTDKLGQPVLRVSTGMWDARKLDNEEKNEGFVRYITQGFEYQMEAIRSRNLERGRALFPITQQTVIADWKGFPYSQMMSIKAVRVFLDSGAMYEAHYPEIVYQIFFINCPPFFNVLISMLKTVMAPKTIGKITCLGSERTDWEDAMRDLIEPAQLSLILEY